MANENEKMKNMVENLIVNLKNQGISVEEAAVLKLGKAPGATNQETQRSVQEILKDMQSKGLYPPSGMKASETAVAPEQPGEDCWCPNCFNFQNFEERLTPTGGQFAYASIDFLGKVYDFKYFKSNEGKEFMMSQAKQFSIDPNWSKSQIQELLNLAVQGKEFDKAQILLTALNNAKN